MVSMVFRLLIIDGGIQISCGDHTTGRSTGLNRFKLMAVFEAAANLIDDLPEGSPHGYFNQTDIANLTCQSKDLGALTLFRANRAKPVGAI